MPGAARIGLVRAPGAGPLRVGVRVGAAPYGRLGGSGPSGTRATQGPLGRPIVSAIGSALIMPFYDHRWPLALPQGGMGMGAKKS